MAATIAPQSGIDSQHHVIHALTLHLSYCHLFVQPINSCSQILKKEPVSKAGRFGTKLRSYNYTSFPRNDNQFTSRAWPITIQHYSVIVNLWKDDDYQS